MTLGLMARVSWIGYLYIKITERYATGLAGKSMLNRVRNNQFLITRISILAAKNLVIMRREGLSGFWIQQLLRMLRDHLGKNLIMTIQEAFIKS